MIVLNQGQQRALNLALNTEDNLFITGSAGTGKTVAVVEIIKKLRAAGRVVRATSFTGLAAQQLGGITLSRLLGLGLAKRISEIRNPCSLHAIAERNLQGVTDLVIDEISMLSGDYLHLVSAVMGDVLCRPGVPFGGVRVIYCGDFLQLPPIKSKGDAPFKVRWAFQCPEFQSARIIQLTERLRQSKQEDLEVLDQFRVCRLGPEAHEFIRQASKRQVINATELHPRNVQVDQINERCLSTLVGDAKVYQTEFNPESSKQLILTNLPIKEEVVLKVGAPVICRANCPERGYFNGTQGRVVEMGTSHVLIQLPGEGIRRIVKHEWQVDVRESGSVVQTMLARGMPLSLGWATTIHKAQGMTLSRISADLSHCWEPGHTYVALSRAKTLEHVALIGPRVEVRTDPEALAFSESLGKR